MGGLFEYRDLGNVALKGFAEDVPVWQRARRGRRRKPVRGTTRDHHAARRPGRGAGAACSAAGSRPRAARAASCSMSGEPGIGKSRLAQTLFERLAGEPHTRLRLFCSPHHQDSALYPTDHPARTGGRLPARGHRARNGSTSWRRLLAQATRQLKRGRAANRRAAVDSAAESAIRRSTSSRRSVRRRRCGRCVAQVEGLAARQPVLMLFEDAHWSDPTSLELAGPDRRSGAGAAPAADRHLPSGVQRRPGPAARTSAWLESQSPAAARSGPRSIAGVTGGKALPQEIADADHRPHRRGAAVRRGADQGGGRERHADRSRRPLRCGRSACRRWRSRRPCTASLACPTGSPGAGARRWRRSAPRCGRSVLAQVDQRRRVRCRSRSWTARWRSWCAPS